MESATATASSSWRTLPGTGVALAATVVAALTIAFGLTDEGTGGVLGATLAPFFATFDVSVDPAAVVAIPVLALALACSIPLVRGAGGVATFLIGALLIALATRLALAAVRDGVDGWYGIFGSDPEAGNEYLPALPALHSLGVHGFLDRFAELSPTLPIHPSAHPPGTLLLLDGLGIESARGMAALVIGVGVLTVPLTYALARRVSMNEERSRAAAMLVAFSPSMALYGVVSTDAMFATLGLAAACLLVGSGLPSRIAGAATLAVASFFSWALLAVGVFAGVVVWMREGFGSAFRLGLVTAAIVIAAYAALYEASGFDPIGAVRAAGDAYDLGISNARPYLYWLFGSPVAFLVALGLPTAWYAARALGVGNAVAVGLIAIVVASVLVGVTKAETERIWQFMVPLAAVAAATLVPVRRMPLILGVLLLQALASSLLLETIW